MNKSLLLFAKKRWIDGWIDRHGQTDDRKIDTETVVRSDGRTDAGRTDKHQDVLSCGETDGMY